MTLMLYLCVSLIVHKNSHNVSVFNYLSKNTPMVTMWLTLCPKELPQTYICLSAIFFDHDSVFPGRMKFYFLEPYPPTREFPWCDFPLSWRRIPWPKDVLFSRPYPPTEEIPWCNFPWLWRRIPWPNEVLFSRTLPPNAIIALVRFSLVTTAYSLVRWIFIFQTLPPHARISLVQFFLVTTSYSLGGWSFIF